MYLVHRLINFLAFLSISFKMTLPQKLLKYREYSRHFWVDSFQNKRQKHKEI